MQTQRVLLAEPDPVLRASYQQLLSAEGFEVDVAENGAECLNKLRGFSPDVLVLEPQLPGGGADVMEALRASENCSPARVMILAGGDDLEQLYRVAAFPVDEWRDKPLSPNHLAASLHRLLASPKPAASRPAARE